MPLSYGGGIKDFSAVQKIMSIGFEKVILNTSTYQNPQLITKVADHFGSQAVVASVDVKKNIWGKYQVYINDGRQKLNVDPIEWVQKLEAAGAGEILLTSMEKEGTWTGYDLEITKKITSATRIPVVANGGAGSIAHIAEVVLKAGASAAAIGSMVVYQKMGMGVLVNFPDRLELEAALNQS
jgi:imidazole glycerol-phosphate synthase subunit HisF